MAETIYYVDPDVSGGAGDGSSWANAYSSLNAAEDARDGDISAGNAVVFLCRSSAGADDPAATTFAGWTTDADSYVAVRADTGDFHNGVWSATKYRLSATMTNLSTYYFRVENLQITRTNAAGVDGLIDIQCNSASTDVRISGCLIKGYGGTTYAENGIRSVYANTNIYIWNTVLYNISTAVSGGANVLAGLGVIRVYSCTGIGGYRAIKVDGGTWTVKNTYLGGSASEDYYRSAGTLNKTNCASEDASADDTSGTDETQSNCITSIALTTATFTNVTAGSEDFHLVVGSGLIGVGTDTSGESAPLNFTTDIVGTTRS